MLLFIILHLFAHSESPVIDWGFYGHRLINRKAVFTLPEDVLPIYKNNIQYINDHAVDPDKRRYAIKPEAVKHYIDLDHWGNLPFDHLPRDLPSASFQYGKFYTLSGIDSSYHSPELLDSSQFFYEVILRRWYDEPLSISKEDIERYFEPDSTLIGIQELHYQEVFREYGILPYNLLTMYNRLVNAFVNLDQKMVLRLSAEMGHYISDGHVPLHTTENYNGQMTNQVGIHAFWESRLPELFAEKEYDFFVGRAEYISDMQTFIWDFILESHRLVDDVLSIEQRLKEEFDKDLQYCYDERLGRIVLVECQEYASAFHEQLDGMVEERMRNAILAIGSIWYSAWVDAGSPTAKQLSAKRELTEEEKEEQKLLEEKSRGGSILGRQHSK